MALESARPEKKKNFIVDELMTGQCHICLRLTTSAVYDG